MSPTHVFICYAQETPAHKAQVLAFARTLQTCGVQVAIDQDVPGCRTDWQLWATRQILSCDFVLVIASRTCRAVGDGYADGDRNRGLQAEMRTLRDLYAADHPRWLRRILPIVLPGATVDDIPLFLQPYNADHYRIDQLSRAGVACLVRTFADTSEPATARGGEAAAGASSGP
jgi:hypothetical protein